VSTYNHTPVAVGESNAPGTLNERFGALDAAIGNLATLSTNAKSSTVAAVNELDTGLDTEAAARLLRDTQLQTLINAVSTESTDNAEVIAARDAGNTDAAVASLADRVGYAAANMYHPMAYGANGDGSTDDRATLNTLANTTMSAGGWIPIDRGYKISSNLTIPAGVHLHFTGNGQLVVPTGVTVTVNGTINAGAHKIFDLTGTGKIAFGEGASPEIWPEWWGADATGITDHQPFIQAAINALPNLNANYETAPALHKGGTVRLADRTYYVNGTPIALKSGVSLVGSGRNTIIRNSSKSTAAITAIGTGAGNNSCYWVEIKNLTILGDGRQGDADWYTAGGHAIHAEYLYMSWIGPVWIYGANDCGIFMEGASYVYVKDSWIQFCGRAGIYLNNPNSDYYTTPSVVTSKYVTAVKIVDTVVRRCGKVGIMGRGVSSTRIEGCQIESNGIDDAADLYEVGSESETDGAVRSMNCYFVDSSRIHIVGNVFETDSGSSTANRTQIVFAGNCWGCLVADNDLNEARGLYLYGLNASGGVLPYPFMMTVRRNEFSYTTNPNMETGKYSGGTAPTAIYFEDNIGVHVSDGAGSEANLILDAHSMRDALGQRYQRLNTVGTITSVSTDGAGVCTVTTSDNMFVPGGRHGITIAGTSTALDASYNPAICTRISNTSFSFTHASLPLSTSAATGTVTVYQFEPFGEDPIYRASYENAGTPNATAYHITLEAAITIKEPDYSRLRGGQRITFHFLQDATGSHGVSWAADWNNAGWSNTGYAANKRSSIEFSYYSEGAVMLPVGAQVAWA
jgi:hypothetical protein